MVEKSAKEKLGGKDVTDLAPKPSAREMLGGKPRSTKPSPKKTPREMLGGRGKKGC